MMWWRKGEVTGSLGVGDGGNSYPGLVFSRSHHMKVLPISPTGHVRRHVSWLVLTYITAGTMALQENRHDSQS